MPRIGPRRVAVAVAALLAAALGWMVLRGNHPTRTGAPPGAEPVPPPSAVGPAIGFPPESMGKDPSIPGTHPEPGPEPQPEPPAQAPPAVFALTVLGSDGGPAVGADIRVFESDPAGPGHGALPRLRGRSRTDSEGRARIEVPGGIGGGFVGASLGDEAALTQEHVFLHPGDLHATTLRLEPSFRIRGCLVDGDGRRVAASSVRLLVLDPLSTASSSIGTYAFEVEPDSLEEGAFEFAPLGRVPRLWAGDGTPIGFRARAEGFLPFEGWMPEARLREGPVELVLTRPGTVRGRCVDGSGDGVAGVVVAPPRGAGEPARTGEDGRFELGGIPETGVELSVSSPGHSARRVRVPPFDGRTGVDVGEITLGEGETVRGLVVDADGLPVAGASVHVSGVSTTTDAEGGFVAEHVGPPPWNVYAQQGNPMDEDCRRVSLRVEERPAGAVRVAFPPGRWVLFVVEPDEGGAREDNPWIDAYLHPPGWKRGDLEDGVRHRWTRLRRFRLEAPANGEWIALVTRNGHEPISVPVVVSGVREPVVRGTLRRAGSAAPR